MGHAIYMGAYKNENNMLVGKLQKKIPVGRSGHIYGKKDKKKIKPSDSVQNSQWTLWLHQCTLGSIANGNFLLTEQLSRSEVSKQWYWGYWSAGNLTNPVVLRNAVSSSSRVSKS